MTKQQIAILAALGLAVLCVLCFGGYIVISEERGYQATQTSIFQPTATRPPTGTPTPRLTDTPTPPPTPTETPIPADTPQPLFIETPIPTDTPMPPPPPPTDTPMPPTDTPYIAPTSPPATQPPPPPPPTEVPAAVCNCSGNIYNCSNFSTHAQAQACYDYCVSIGRGDVHGLDGSDNDGIACESLQ